MSADQHEGDNGPELPTREKENEPELGSNSGDTELDFKLPKRKLRRPTETEEDEDAIQINGTDSDGDTVKQYGGEQDDHSGPDIEPFGAFERPSSAEESLSVPDDSPSVQVRTVGSVCITDF